MSYKVLLTENFKKNAKALSKKFPSLKSDLSKLFDELSEKPLLGTSLGNNIFKIRLAITSTGKGKSGGARIISVVRVVEQNVFLIAIYSKSERDSISQKDILEIMKSEKII